MIKRNNYLRKLRLLLRRNPIAVVLGARQVGKTTLARQLASSRRGAVHFFDLENPAHRARLADPLLALERLRGLVVLDEVQQMPQLFPVLRVLADRPRTACRFLLLGSASPELAWRSSESLAGRVGFLRLGPFTLDELPAGRRKHLWLRGGFPRSLLAPNGRASFQWRLDFISTFLERDVPRLGIGVGVETLRRFWSMLAHYHGQVWNASEFGRSFGVADTTARKYLDILAGAFLVRVLKPFFENIRKRQVKSPRIFLADSGLLHALLNLPTTDALESHPKVGASWEGFLLEQVIHLLDDGQRRFYFWATHSGAELDLLVEGGGQRLGFEFKRTSSPGVTRSMRTAIADLGLKHLFVVYAGPATFPLDRKITALSWQDIVARFRKG